MDERHATRRKVMTPLLDDDTHTRWVKAVFEAIPDYDPSEEPSSRDLIYFLATIVSTSEGRLNPKYEKTPAAKALLEGDAELMEKLRVAWKDTTLTEISQLPVLQAEQRTSSPAGSRAYTRPREHQAEATEKSWEYPFQGNAAKALWEHIETHYNPSNFKVYAHYAAIVQSSGMGKSRTVDELAKDHFVIPLNLRDKNSTGYPPPDHAVRDYLTSTNSRDHAYDRACAFLEALFKHLAEVLHGFEGSLDYKGLAQEFRTRMTEGQKMTGHNEFRQDFYSEVIQKAKQLESERASSANPTASSKGKSSDHPNYFSPTRGGKNFPPYQAFEQLARLLRAAHDASPSPSPSQSRRRGKPKKSGNVPIVILAADEAHTLTERRGSAGGEWSIFNELRHAFRGLHNLPLFTLFLSTTGKISQFTSTMEEDLSARIVEGILILIQPFTDLGFDPLAHIISLDGTWDLERLTEDAHISSLGRPLFAARFREGSDLVKQEVIQFAVAKLLNATTTPDDLSNDQVLACLSQRFPIEFNSTNYIAQEKERKQVEGHLRVCLKIDGAFQTMTTTSSSEPILSEAAYFVMQRQSFNPPNALKSVMEGFSISKGDRGEFLVLLLLILARDATVGVPDDLGRPINGRRWFPLSGFLYGQLFRKQTLPSEIVDADSIKALAMFQKDFPNAQLHFNHFIKVHEYKAIDITSLLLLQGRGAAVLCANNQTGLDAVNVFLREGTQLIRDNAGLVLTQVKNDSTYTKTPRKHLFDVMDPYDLGILDSSDTAVPLIKITFALAAKTPCLNVVRHSPTTQYNAVVYEIWCAGLSPEILAPIEHHQAGTWDSLLQASYGWRELYKGTSAVIADLRRSAMPGAARESGHYFRWGAR